MKKREERIIVVLVNISTVIQTIEDFKTNA